VIYVRATMIQKMFGFGLVGLALLGVYAGHSAGTIVSIAAVAMTAVALRIMRNYGKAAILLIMPFLFIIPFFFILADTGELFGNFLQFFGKDKTLTGRTDLWGTAFHEIGERLLLGKGYGAFWRIGNPEAEKLWALFHIDTRVGFNFHNEYLNTAVDLGILGLMINVTLLVCVATRSIQLRLRQPETQLTAIHSMFLFFLYLTSVEQEFFYTFLLSPVILCMVWADRRTDRKPDQHVSRVESRPPASAKTPP
jgi:exopolysaccharide production protein ExoQ